ncbi:MAG: hypothetical protein PVF51_10045, partial [Nitrospirota bacterium]
TRTMNSGKIPISFLLFIAVVSVGTYVGWQLGRPWMSYYQFKDQVHQIVNAAAVMTSEKRLQNRIYDAVDESGVWIEDPKHDVHVYFRPGHARVTAEWTEFVFFPFDIEYSHDFSVDESGSFD